MYLPSLRFGLGDIFFQLRERERLGDTHRSGLVADQRLWSHPDDIIDIDIVAENNLFSGLQVDDRGQIRVGQTEIIIKGTVLAVTVGIAGIVDGRLSSSQK